MTSPDRNAQNDTTNRGNTQQSKETRQRDPSPQRTHGQVQGEGNYDAAREYDEAQRKFVESGKVDAAAQAAKPKSAAEEQEMLDAERKGKSRAKEEDPAITRPQSKKSTP